MRIYDKVKDLAKSRNISIAELERRLELSNGSISKWNTYMPNTEPLLKVANFFGVSTDYLLGYDSSEVSKQSQKSVAIQRKAEKLSDKQQDMLNELIDEFLKSKK